MRGMYKFISILLVWVLLCGCFMGNATSFPAKAESTKSNDGIFFAEGTNNENQLWCFEAVSNETDSKLYIKNQFTQKYIFITNNKVSTDYKTNQSVPTAFNVSANGEGYVISFSGGYLAKSSNSVSVSKVAYTFEFLSFSENTKTEFCLNGTFAVCGDNMYLTDGGNAYFTLSNKANQRTNVTIQKWHIDRITDKNGINYYTIFNIDDSTYISVKNGNAVCGISRADESAFWSIRQISVYDIDSKYSVTDNYTFLYVLQNKNGEFLFFDYNEQRFKVSKEIEFTPSSVFLFNDGGKFLSGNTSVISTLGGFGDSNKYDVNCRRYLQCVEAGYETNVFVSPESFSENQQWELTYISSSVRSGKWYKNHYYTIKSVKTGMYLSVKDGALVLTERNTADNNQLWCFFDMRWGWTVTDQAIDRADDEFSGRFALKNKGTSECLVVSNDAYELQYTSSDDLGGGQGALWLLNGDNFDLGHYAGNNNPAQLKQSVVVTLNAYATSNYLTGDGPKYDSVYMEADSALATDWIIKKVGTKSYSVLNGTTPVKVTANSYTIKNKLTGLYLTANYKVVNGNLITSVETTGRDELNDGQLWSFLNAWDNATYLNLHNHGYYYSDSNGNNYPAMINVDSTINAVVGEKAAYNGNAYTVWDLNGESDFKLYKDYDEFEAVISLYWPVYYLVDSTSGSKDCKITTTNVNSTAHGTKWLFTPVKEITYKDVYGTQRTDTAYTLKSTVTGNYLVADYDKNGTLTVKTADLVTAYSDNNLWIFHNTYGADYYNIINVFAQKQLFLNRTTNSFEFSDIVEHGAGEYTYFIDGKENDINEFSNNGQKSFVSDICLQFPNCGLLEEYNVSVLDEKVKIQTSSGFTVSETDTNNIYRWRLKAVHTENNVTYYTVENIATGNYLTNADNGIFMSEYKDGDIHQWWQFVDCKSLGTGWEYVYEIQPYGSNFAINTVGGNDGNFGKDGLMFGDMSGMSQSGGRGWTLSKNRGAVEIFDGIECVINSYQWSLNYYLYDNTPTADITVDTELVVAERMMTNINYHISTGQTPLFLMDGNNVAQVNANGAVFGLEVGKANLKVRVGKAVKQATVTVKKYGDINLDDNVDVLDFIAIYKNICGQGNRTAIDDLNLSGTVEANDIVVLKKLLLGIITQI